MMTEKQLTDADIIAMNVMWNRLISVCEEQANALLRVAFGAIVREAGDLSAGIFDASGRMMAQAVTGTPGHVNTMAKSVNAMLEHVPAETLEEGDVLVTNDPWLGAGHVFDFVLVTPVFRKGTIVAYIASTCHVEGDILHASLMIKSSSHDILFLLQPLNSQKIKITPQLLGF